MWPWVRSPLAGSRGGGDHHGEKESNILTVPLRGPGPATGDACGHLTVKKISLCEFL